MENDGMMMDRIVNIALVGHVANGKTTLVNALTGVNTKRSSGEQQSGRTVKLGYANCILWHCSKCKTTHSKGQADKHPCDGAAAGVVVSFVDAPGHHSYVHTMVKGATVVDGALLVTDVRREPMQVQTMEHLAILTILGIKNIIVVQNKADLVNSAQCIEHKNKLVEELIGTAAENSPIMPVSAQNNINIDELRYLLLQMALGLKTKPIHQVNGGAFSIIRSFDINKPGDDIDPRNLKGGVLGGTIVGNVIYKVGDVVEIRPGIIKNRNEWRSITTTIMSIYSENVSCSQTTIGGLYGIGTTIDPTLTAADGLNGNMMGKSGDLPPTITEIDMRVVHVNMAKTMDVKVKPRTLYKLIIGNSVVNAEAVVSKTSKKHMLMRLDRPICTLETRCLIYTLESSNSQLIAFGKFGDQEETEVEVVVMPSVNYNSLVKDLAIGEIVRTKVPAVKVDRVGRNVIWSNINDVAKSIYRKPTEVGNYLAAEMMFNVAICDGGLRIYKSTINSSKIESIVRKYVREFVVCGQCKSLNTTAGVGCNQCGALGVGSKL